jgi:ABC-type glycerol-3-phosphate transport system substrate-binding protein
MARTTKADRRRIRIALAALALLAGCSQAARHNSAENEFTAWANEVEREDANRQTIPDFEEPANVMARVVPANGQ